MNGPPDATEFDYLPGMLPPPRPERDDTDPGWRERDGQWALAFKRRRARRSLLTAIGLFLVLVVATWLVVPLAWAHMMAYERQQQHQGATP